MGSITEARKVVLTAKRKEDLSDIERRLNRLGDVFAQWMEVEVILGNQQVLRSAKLIIVDEVDAEFRRLEPLIDIEEWLINVRNNPRVVFLVADGDRHLDRVVKALQKIAVHYLTDEITDERLYSWSHSG